MSRIGLLMQSGNVGGLLAVSLVTWTIGMQSENPIIGWSLVLFVSPAFAVASLALAIFLFRRAWGSATGH
jgi:hypothetical protein